MRLSRDSDLIKIAFPYDEDIISKIKTISKYKYNPDPLGPYWTVPVKQLSKLVKVFDLTPADLYPDFMNYISKNSFMETLAELKYDRVKIAGRKKDLLLKSLNILLSAYEDTLGECIYNHNNTAVFKFPPGAYWRVLDFLEKSYIQTVVHTYPPAPNSIEQYQTTLKGRPYQTKAVSRIIKKEIPNRATLVMATGAGKTILSAMIAKELGVNTIFYTYSTDLLEQTATEYEKFFGCKIGRVSRTKLDIQPITIAMIQTVHSCLQKQDERWQKLSGYLNNVELMFVDEGHMLGADTIYNVASATDTYYSYALTATPYREDGKEIFIEAATGPVVELIAEEELIRGGYILPVEVEIIPIEHNKYIGKRYNTQYSNAIVKNRMRNKIIADTIEKYREKKTLILVKEIAHGEILSEMTGVPFLHGSSKNRKEALKAFSSGEIQSLIATSILKQGVDLPEAEVLIMAHGGSGIVEILQKIGRIRRPATGKKVGQVIDFYDYCPRSNQDTFKQQAQKRLALYRERNFEILEK